jgi:hypothetical protein
MLQTLSINDQSESEKEDKIYEILNDRIYIDDIPLGEKNISDNVFFEFKSNDESVKDEKYELKLSKILPSYKDQTEALTKVIDNFESSIKTFLRSKVFKARPKPKNEIFREIKEDVEKVLTAYQIFFLVLHYRNHPNVKVFEGKLNLAGYYDEFGETEDYKKNIVEFLEILDDYKYLKSSFSFVFCGIDIKNTIYNQSYAIEEEKLPKFILDWIEKDSNKKEGKIEFLYNLGQLLIF